MRLNNKKIIFFFAIIVSITTASSENRVFNHYDNDCGQSQKSQFSFNIGATFSGLVGSGPFGPDIVGSVVESGPRTIYSVYNYREEQDYLWGFEAGSFVKLEHGERVELLVAFAKTRAGLIAFYSTEQIGESLHTYRSDSLELGILEITPRLRFSAAMPYGFEPYIGVGLTTNTFDIVENYGVDGTFTDSAGGRFTANFEQKSKIYTTGLNLLLGLRVRFTDNFACRLEADGVFQPNKNLSLSELNTTVYPSDNFGNPRSPIEIDPIPREHRMRLTHVTARFGVEFSIVLK